MQQGRAAAGRWRWALALAGQAGRHRDGAACRRAEILQEQRTRAMRARYTHHPARETITIRVH